MAEWTPPLCYNYNQPYRHAYAYGLMYQPGPERSLNTWGEAVASDLSNNNDGVRQTHYGAASPTQGASPPDSPEEQGPCQFPDSDVFSPGAPEESPLLPNEANTASFNTAAIVALLAASDSTSDTETCVSTDSWRSCSSRESLPHMDPATWAQNGPNYETSKKSPDPGTSRKELKTNEITETETTNNTEPEPLIATNEPSTTTLRKAKGRSAFSESQMNILMERFTEKKYLTPAEMKNVAEMTGLTYKQVKTWFQNRRMKRRRLQQEATSLVSECYAINGDPIYGGLVNIPPHMQHYQGHAQPQLQDQFNQKMMGAPFTTPQNLPFYLSTMGSSSAAAGHPAWPPGPNQNAMATRPQRAGWSMSPSSSHFEYNPYAFNPSNVPANTLGYDAGFEIKNGESYNSGSFNAARGYDVGQ